MLPTELSSIKLRLWARYLRQFKVLLTTVLTLVCVSGCNPWPPGHNTLADHYAEKRSVFLALEKKFISSNWMQACSGTGAADLVVKKLGQKAHALSSDHASSIRELLDESGMYCVEMLQNGAVGYEPYYSRESSGFLYEIRLTHNGSQVNVTECRDVEDRSTSGHCIVGLDVDWRIEYGWSRLSD